MVVQPNIHESYFTPEQGLLLWIDANEPSEDRYITYIDHIFDNGNIYSVVPAGTKSDLASIPSPFRWFFSPTGRHQRAALHHDQFCLIAQTWAERRYGDIVFGWIMELDGVGLFSRLVLSGGVWVGSILWALGKRHPPQRMGRPPNLSELLK